MIENPIMVVAAGDLGGPGADGRGRGEIHGCAGHGGEFAGGDELIVDGRIGQGV